MLASASGTSMHTVTKVPYYTRCKKETYYCTYCYSSWDIICAVMEKSCKPTIERLIEKVYETAETTDVLSERLKEGNSEKIKLYFLLMDRRTNLI